MAEQDEVKLARDLIVGQAGAFDRFVEYFRGKIFQYSFLMCGQREDAEDVAQEAFARGYQRFGQLRDRNRFRSWIVRLTWRLAIDRRRADLRRTTREVAYAKPVVPMSNRREERTFEVWRAIDALPKRVRLVMVLAAIQGHDTREVAAALGVPEGTVKSRLFKARQLLKEQLG